MKYTLLVTQRCNLACDYCYIGKRNERMPVETAAQVVDFAYGNTPLTELVEICFFGGEPLLELELIRRITELIESHESYDPQRVRLTIITNGTIFNSRIAAFVTEHDIAFGISCDGPPAAHDGHRRTRRGRGSSRLVERTIRSAVATIPALMVNAVYRPDTLPLLAETVEYLSALGVRHIYLSPDFSAPWTPADAAILPEVYSAIGDFYVRHQRTGDPHFINLIDTKVAVILRRGYQPLERCRMGRGEFAFTPSGDIYPCERLVGNGSEEHRIGSVAQGITLAARSGRPTANHCANRECVECGLRAYCMNWCGCSNYFSTGRYDAVGPFLCASEQAAIRASFDVLNELAREGEWYDHLSGAPGIQRRRDRRLIHRQAADAIF